MSKSETIVKLSSSAVPTDADMAVWRAMTRDEQLAAFPDFANHPYTTTPSSCPLAEIIADTRGTRIVGRKRHIAVDTDGRLLMVNLTPADLSDSAGAQILDAIRKRWPWLKHLFAFNIRGCTCRACEYC